MRPLLECEFSLCEWPPSVQRFVAMIALRHHATAALAAALLALPVSSLAQPKARATAPTATRPPAGTATPATARPAPVPAPEPAAPPIEEKGPWRLGGSIGYENDSDAEVKGPRLQLEAERDLVKLGARGQLSFVAAAAWFHGTRSDSATVLGITTSADVTQNLLEIVPSFRASYALVPRLRFFAELGVGAAWAFLKTETTISPPPVTVITKDDAFAGVLRLSAGATFQLNERVRVGVVLPTFSWRYGDSTSQTFSLSAMAAYAL